MSSKAPINPTSTTGSTTGQQGSDFGPSTGYDNNVSSATNDPPAKHGLVEKIKEKLAPNGPGKTEDGVLGKEGAAGFHPERVEGRHEQANRDLNRE